MIECPDCKRYLELLREQDTFIQKIKRFVRDFNIRDGDYDAFKRDIADRGFRPLIHNAVDPLTVRPRFCRPQF